MKDKHDNLTIDMPLGKPVKYQASYLQWAGGKGKVLKTLIPILEQYKKPHFCEPFVGACNVALNFMCDKATLVDLNRDVIESHKVVCTETSEYIKMCERLFGESFDTYYDKREEFNNSPFSVERAALFQYINKHGFNGLCRYNKKGLLNVPKGTVKKNGCNVPYDQILNFSKKFTGEEFVHGSFEDYMQFPEPSLIYCDPPYVPMTASDFKYNAEDFGASSQIKLRDLAKKSRNTVIISNHWNEVTQELYKDADRIEVIDVQRTISCKGTDRVKVKECIVVYE